MCFFVPTILQHNEICWPNVLNVCDCFQFQADLLGVFKPKNRSSREKKTSEKHFKFLKLLNSKIKIHSEIKKVLKKIQSSFTLYCNLIVARHSFLFVFVSLRCHGWCAQKLCRGKNKPANINTLVPKSPFQPSFCSLYILLETHG